MRHLGFALFLLFLLPLTSCRRNDNTYSSNWESPRSEADDPKAPSGYGAVYFFEWPREEQKPVNILFSVDNSDSMAPFIGAVEDNIGRFISNLFAQGINFRLGFVISTITDGAIGSNFVKGDDPEAENKVVSILRNFKNQPGGGAERAIWILENAIDDPQNSFFFGENHTVFIALTDAIDIQYEPTSDVPGAAKKIIDHFNQKLPQGWSFYGIGSPSDNPCTKAENISQPLMEWLVKQAGGIFGRICDANYASILSEALKRVGSESNNYEVAPRERRLSYVDPARTRVFVDGKEVPNSPTDGFQFNAATYRLSFSEKHKPRWGAHIDVHLYIIPPDP